MVDSAQQCMQQCFASDKAVILMASSIGPPAARGSGVGSFRVT